METSKGSEQWGYILKTPETKASRIDNLNDGLIASELAPDGKDQVNAASHGMCDFLKVTTQKRNDSSTGNRSKCVMTHWQPEQRVTLEQLAVRCEP